MPRRLFVCSECGCEAAQWRGQCVDCNAWNTLTETVVPYNSATASGSASRSAPAFASPAKVYDFDSIQPSATLYQATALGEFDRVLGGGLVPGTTVLIGGEPGIGKSTLLLQVAASAYQHNGLRTLYVGGEESLQQVNLRADRLGIKMQGMRWLGETQIEMVLPLLAQEQPAIVVIDSIQTLFSEAIQSAPGSVSQVRDCAASLVYYAKRNATTMLIVGHVTKGGVLAGPRVLEHMVDTVLYFESEADRRFRVIRSIKNRYGEANEIGIFAMSATGLKAVRNPSALFLSRTTEPTPGSVITVTREGTRLLLIEIQALLDKGPPDSTRRVTVGLDAQRLAMLLAVLHRHASSSTHSHDVFLNAVGGVRITETSADLAIIVALRSSLYNIPLPRSIVVFGEIGLAGEVRPIPYGEERIREAVKHGMSVAVVPFANQPHKPIPGIDIIAVKRVTEALAALEL